MADYVEITAEETDAGAFLRQALGKKFKNNFINHEDRLGTVEDDIIIFDHFNVFVPTPVTFDGAGTTPKERIYNRRWIWASGFNATSGSDPSNPSIPAYSVVRLDADASASNDDAHSGLYSIQEFVFDNVTKPIRFEARVQWRGGRSNHTIEHKWGLFDTYVLSTGTPNAPRGIYLELATPTTMRFLSRNASGTFTGTPFTAPTADTWFKVRIEFTDDPSDRAVCYIDDVPKETIVANLPTPDRLRSGVVAAQDYTAGVGSGTTAFQVDADRIRYGCPGFTDAA